MSAAAVAVLVLVAAAEASPLTSHVNPLFATRGGGGFGAWGNEARSPGAMYPHPLVRLGPDTTRVDPVLGEAWSHLNRHAGYFGSDTHVRAFSLALGWLHLLVIAAALLSLSLLLPADRQLPGAKAVRETWREAALMLMPPPPGRQEEERMV